MSLSIKCDLAALDSMLQSLENTVGESTRPAAQAAAQVIYNAVKQNVSRIGKKSGNLQSAIYQAFSRDNSGPLKATYHISWNARKAPHGHLLEYGHIQRYKTILTKSGKWITLKKEPLAAPRQVGARPFVRPAVALFPQALEAAKAELMKRINEKAK